MPGYPRRRHTPEAPNAGAVIRAAREKVSWSRHQLAEALGVSYQRLCDIELDRKPITLESVLAIADALAVDPHTLDARLASRKPARSRP